MTHPMDGATVTVPTRLHADDAALIEQSWHEPEAFAGLYDRHAAHLHRYVTRRLGSQVADDVVGDTFLCAFRRRRRYDLSRPNAGPWLYGIAANASARSRCAAGDREVLLLIAWAELAYDEVAVALGIPVGTVRSRLHRARKKVREALGGEDPTTISEEPSA
jgi:RNA polymerase sigma-70 factor (ECF subfamily)